MPHDLTLATASNKLAYTLVKSNNLSAAIFNFEQSLQNLADELLDTDDAKRCKISSCLGLVDALLKNNNYIIDTNALTDRIKKLFKTALKLFDQLDNSNDADIAAKINTHLQLALIYFGEEFLHYPLKATYFKPLTALHHLSSISVSLKDMSRNEKNDRFKFLYYLAELNYKILDFIVSKYHQESETKKLDDESYDIATASDIGLLSGLDLLRQIKSSAQRDDWWRLKLNYFVLANDISFMQHSTLKKDYIKLFLDNFTQIKIMTAEDVIFLNKIITDNLDSYTKEDNSSDNSVDDHHSEDNYTDNTIQTHGVDHNYSDESSFDLSKIIRNINIEIIRIKKMVELLNTQTEPQIIQLIYAFLLTSFTTIHTQFKLLCDDNSYPLKIADYGKDCFSASSVDPNQTFPVDLIHDLNRTAQIQSNDILQNKAVEVHKLCVTVVLALYQRADFPNKQLQFHLQDPNKKSLFNFGPIEINPSYLKDVNNSDYGNIEEPDVEPDLPITLMSNFELQATQQLLNENRKRKSGASVGENPFILMAPASPSAQEIEMKISRNDPTAKENPYSPGNR